MAIRFDGYTYDPKEDKARLSTQLGRVKKAMSDGTWWTISQLQAECGGTEAAISSRIRDLRKARFGGHKIYTKRLQRGLWAYKMEK